MNIVVLVKQVPDSGSERKLDPADNTVARASADNVINEMDEYAIEEALLVRDAQGGEVTILTVGPDSATSQEPDREEQPGEAGAVAGEDVREVVDAEEGAAEAERTDWSNAATA